MDIRFTNLKKGPSRRNNNDIASVTLRTVRSFIRMWFVINDTFLLRPATNYHPRFTTPALLFWPFNAVPCRTWILPAHVANLVQVVQDRLHGCECMGPPLHRGVPEPGVGKAAVYQ